MTCITRYFQLDPENVKGYKGFLFSDSDVLPLTNLKIIPGPFLSNGKQLVKAELPGYMIEDMMEQCLEYGIYDPLSLAGIKALDIESSYIGVTREDVLKKFPELKGTTKVGTDEEGKPIYVDKFPVMQWAGEVM